MSHHYEALTQRPKSVCVLGNVCAKFKCKILRETFCVWSSKWCLSTHSCWLSFLILMMVSSKRHYEFLNIYHQMDTRGKTAKRNCCWKGRNLNIGMQTKTMCELLYIVFGTSGKWTINKQQRRWYNICSACMCIFLTLSLPATSDATTRLFKGMENITRNILTFKLSRRINFIKKIPLLNLIFHL